MSYKFLRDSIPNLTRKMPISSWTLHLPIISFLLPCTMSLPATLTREKFNLLPMSTAWLQFSTLLNGICIGGRLAHFQATDPGATLSKTCNSIHLHYHSPNENCCASLQRLCTTTSHQTLDWVPSPLQHCSTFEMQSRTALTSEREDHLQVEDTQFMIFIISLQAPTSLIIKGVNWQHRTQRTNLQDCRENSTALGR